MLQRLLKLSRQDVIQSDRVYLRHPQMSDWKAWSTLRRESRQFLIPWEPTWSQESLGKSSFRGRLRQYERDAKADIGHAFFIFQRGSDQLVGSITLSNIRRGVAQTGTIGYWTGQKFGRHGYMYDGICTLLPVLFEQYGLRRIEAACLLDNIPSASLLRKVGFTHEGHARQYLRINGVWQDHFLFGILKDDPVGNGSSGVTDIRG